MAVFYDFKPSKYEAVGNGSFKYRWNIEEVIVEQTSEDGKCNTKAKTATATKKQYKCDEVVVWATVTSNKITQAVINSICDNDEEQKLINEYNAATIGMISGEEATAKIAAYKDFLTLRATVKAQVDADCEELGIK